MLANNPNFKSQVKQCIQDYNNRYQQYKSASFIDREIKEEYFVNCIESLESLYDAVRLSSDPQFTNSQYHFYNGQIQWLKTTLNDQPWMVSDPDKTQRAIDQLPKMEQSPPPAPSPSPPIDQPPLDGSGALIGVAEIGRMAAMGGVPGLGIALALARAAGTAILPAQTNKTLDVSEKIIKQTSATVVTNNEKKLNKGSELSVLILAVTENPNDLDTLQDLHAKLRVEWAIFEEYIILEDAVWKSFKDPKVDYLLINAKYRRQLRDLIHAQVLCKRYLRQDSAPDVLDRGAHLQEFPDADLQYYDARMDHLFGGAVRMYCADVFSQLDNQRITSDQACDVLIMLCEIHWVKTQRLSPLHLVAEHGTTLEHATLMENLLQHKHSPVDKNEPNTDLQTPAWCAAKAGNVYGLCFLKRNRANINIMTSLGRYQAPNQEEKDDGTKFYNFLEIAAIHGRTDILQRVLEDDDFEDVREALALSNVDMKNKCFLGLMRLSISYPHSEPNVVTFLLKQGKASELLNAVLQRQRLIEYMVSCDANPIFQNVIESYAEEIDFDVYEKEGELEQRIVYQKDKKKQMYYRARVSNVRDRQVELCRKIEKWVSGIVNEAEKKDSCFKKDMQAKRNSGKTNQQHIIVLLTQYLLKNRSFLRISNDDTLKSEAKIQLKMFLLKLSCNNQPKHRFYHSEKILSSNEIDEIVLSPLTNWIEGQLKNKKPETTPTSSMQEDKEEEITAAHAPVANKEPEVTPAPEYKEEIIEASSPSEFSSKQRTFICEFMEIYRDIDAAFRAVKNGGALRKPTTEEIIAGQVATCSLLAAGAGGAALVHDLAGVAQAGGIEALNPANLQSPKIMTSSIIVGLSGVAYTGAHIFKYFLIRDYKARETRYFDAFGNLDFFQTAEFIKMCASYFAWKYSLQIERLHGGRKGVVTLAEVIVLRIINFITTCDPSVTADKSAYKRLLESLRRNCANIYRLLQDSLQGTSTPQQREKQKTLWILALQGVYKGKCKDASIENESLFLEDDGIHASSGRSWKSSELIDTGIELLEDDEEKESGFYAPEYTPGEEKLVDVYGYCYGVKQDLMTRGGFKFIGKNPQKSPTALPNAPLAPGKHPAHFNQNEGAFPPGYQPRFIGNRRPNARGREQHQVQPKGYHPA